MQSKTRKRVIRWLIILVLSAACIYAVAVTFFSACALMDLGVSSGGIVLNLKQITLAMHSYHDEYKTLPPAALRDADGRPLLSWRVLILPYMEQDKLYSRFNLDEPWDSPHNMKLLDEMLFAFMNGSKHKLKGKTHYQVLIGPGTAFERDGLTLDDFVDRGSRTIAIVEAREAAPWTKPEDLVYDPNKSLPKFYRSERYKSWWTWTDMDAKRGFLVSLIDGSVRGFRYPIDENEIRGLIGRSGRARK